MISREAQLARQFLTQGTDGQLTVAHNHTVNNFIAGISSTSRSLQHIRISLRQARISNVLERTEGLSSFGGYKYRARW
ncbi:hypothetical protein JCM5350_007025 [Sporobolomyces pararoseus]